MAAFTRWEQIPFTIWQRPDSSAETRSRLGRETTECFIAVTFHVALLHIESPPAGEAYVLLINKLQKQKNDNQDLAWRSPLLVGDENMAVNPPFTFDVKASAELRLCRLAMRRELSAWSRLSRRNTCKKLAATRSEHGPTDHEETRALAGNQRSDNL